MMIDYSEIVVGLIVAFFAAILGLLIKPFRNRILSLLKYPVIMEYESQFETKMGYLFVARIRSEKNKLISVPKARFSVKLVFDKKLLNQIEKGKVIYGVHVLVFDSYAVSKAFMVNRSFGNVNDYISCTKYASPLFLLVRIKGPGSANPSSRFQLGRVHKSIKIKIRKTLISFTYLEIPLKHVTIIAGNGKTRIVQE